MTAPCPTPWKIQYPTRRAARTFARSHKTPLKDGQVRPYMCPCGNWHLTSMSRRQVKAIQKRAA